MKLQLSPASCGFARRAVSFVAAGVAGLAVTLAAAAPAQASSVEWVDGGDDSPCVQDDVGAALTKLDSSLWCQPIPGCYEYDGNNPKYKGRIVQPSASTGIWQGAASEVLYADALPTDYTLTSSGSGSAGSSGSGSGSSSTGSSGSAGSSSSSGTKSSASGSKKTSSSSGAAAKSSTSSTKKSTKKSAASTSTTTGSKSSTATGSTQADDDLTGGADEVATVGAPSAPGQPTLTVDGTSITVTWEASADVELDSVTSYTVQLSGGNKVSVAADTLTYTFTDLPDGSYRAAVRAVNDTGESVASTPSDAVVVGDPVDDVQGTLSWDGDVTPGGTVTITGAGYEPNTALVIELHSDPVTLGTVTTDAAGAFTLDAAIPADTPAGDHTFVVATDSDIITETAVTVIASAPTA
ncbi:fibronectin type III domain-containing protein, partial [Rarobacter incanus]